mmetsp:Transcript_48563/g.96822  ORF Transcript_48563/g.96822 Transcript_48563/m.96822 type:complete len:222 (-) Transcript_48563:191-856(-)
MSWKDCERAARCFASKLEKSARSSTVASDAPASKEGLRSRSVCFGSTSCMSELRKSSASDDDSRRSTASSALNVACAVAKLAPTAALSLTLAAALSMLRRTSFAGEAGSNSNVDVAMGDRAGGAALPTTSLTGISAPSNAEKPSASPEAPGIKPFPEAADIKSFASSAPFVSAGTVAPMGAAPLKSANASTAGGSEVKSPNAASAGDDVSKSDVSKAASKE